VRTYSEPVYAQEEQRTLHALAHLLEGSVDPLRYVCVQSDALTASSARLGSVLQRCTSLVSLALSRTSERSSAGTAQRSHSFVLSTRGRALLKGRYRSASAHRHMAKLRHGLRGVRTACG
jgi:hypothetical protein